MIELRIILMIGVMMMCFIPSVSNVSAEPTLELLENTDRCTYNSDLKLDHCFSKYLLCDNESSINKNDIGFKFYDEQKWYIGDDVKNKQKLEYETEMEKKDDCYEVSITGWKNPFINIDNVLCYDGVCFYEFVWWNTSMTRFPLTQLNNITNPFLVNDSSCLDIGGGIQCVWCNATATFVYNDTLGNIYCANDTTQLPTFTDEGNGTDFGNMNGEITLFLTMNGTGLKDTSAYSQAVTVTGSSRNESGQIGGAMNFDGTTGDMVTVADDSGFNNDDFSFSVWTHYSAALGGDNIFIGKWGEPGNRAWLVDQRPADNNLKFFKSHDGTTVELGVFSGTYNPQPGDWNHTVVTYNSTSKTATLYVDAVQIGTVVVSNAAVANVQDIEAGSVTSQGNIGIIGMLDMLKYYNKTLTFDEINATYMNENGGKYSTVGQLETFEEINIISPENITYNTTFIPLLVNSTVSIDEWFYSLNGAANVTFNENGTNITAQEGSNTIIVYANATGGSLLSAIQYFTVILPPPPEPVHSFTVFKLVDVPIPFIGGWLSSLTFKSIILFMDRLTVSGNVVIGGDLIVDGNITGGPIILQVTNITNNITDINGTDVWVNSLGVGIDENGPNQKLHVDGNVNISNGNLSVSGRFTNTLFVDSSLGIVGINTTPEANYSLFVQGMSRFNGNVTINGSIKTGLESIEFFNKTGRLVGTIKARELSVGAAKRDVINIDTDFVIQKVYNGTLVLGIRNFDTGVFSGVTAGLANNINDGLGLFKFNKDNPNEFHSRSGILSNEFGNFEILQNNLGNNLSLGFFDDAIVFPDFTIAGFENITNVIDIMNKTYDYLTQFNFGVLIKDFLNVSGDLRVEGNITGNSIAGAMYTKNNTIETQIDSQDVYYNVTAGFVEEFSNGVITLNGALIPQFYGRYEAIFSGGFADGNNVLFHFSIGVNGVAQDNCHIPRKLGANDQGAFGISCTLLLHQNDIVNLMVENKVGTQNVTVTDGNLRLERRWDA